MTYSHEHLRKLWQSERLCRVPCYALVSSGEKYSKSFFLTPDQTSILAPSRLGVDSYVTEQNSIDQSNFAASRIFGLNLPDIIADYPENSAQEVCKTPYP